MHIEPLLTNRMDSVQTHYAAQRDASESPAQPAKSPIPSPLRVPKRHISTIDLKSPPAKRPTPNPERTSDDNLSPQGRDIQNFTRQEFQKRWQKKLGLASAEEEDSVELESRRVARKTGLEGGVMLKSRAVDATKRGGRVIPVKHALGGAEDDSSLTYSSSRDFSIPIQPPVLPLEEPSIVLVREEEPALPKDKKVPVKHTPKTPQMDTRALVIPAAKTNDSKVSTATKRSIAPSKPVHPSPVKLAIPIPKFTMGSIPPSSTTHTGRRPQRSASTTISSPPKPRISRSASAQRAAPTSKRLVIPHGKSKTVDLKVATNFDGGKSKRKHTEANESSPAKRMKLNEVFYLGEGTTNQKGMARTPVRTTSGTNLTTPSTAVVRHPTANQLPWTPGTVSSRTPVLRKYGTRQRTLHLEGNLTLGSVSSRPPWR